MSLRQSTTPQGSQHPATTHCTPQGYLNRQHHKVLVEGSGIDPQVIAERGVRSVVKGQRGRGLPKVYSRRQKARGNGILFTVHRPHGETATIFRPDEVDPENPGHKYEQPVKRLGGAGNVLDVHPNLHHLIDDKNTPALFTEGIKKADAVTSATRREGTDILPVAIAGVWNWLSEGEPIADMYDLPVEGRKAYVCFDSDMLRKPEVQMAAERLAEHLRQRGAEVEVVYLEDQEDGSKTGADDFLAAGGTLEGLLELASPYEPGDLQTERLSRNKELRISLGYLLDEGEKMPTKTKRDCSKRATWRACMEFLEKRGELVEDGVEAIIPSMRGAEIAHISQDIFSACMRDLVEEGKIHRIKAENREHADSYVLLVPKRAELVNNGTQRNESNIRYEEVYRGYREVRALPEVRWSTPGSRKTKRGVAEGTRKPRQGVPSGETEAKHRPGKQRDEAIRYLRDNEGRATVPELMERFAASPKTRPRDFKRRFLSELTGFRRQHQGQPLTVGPPVIEIDGDEVRLVDGWEDAWEKHRILSGEQEAERKQKRDNMMRRIAYRRRMEITADPAPTEEEMAEGREDREKQRRAARLVDEGMSRRYAVAEVYGADPKTGEMLDSQTKPRAPEPPDDPELHPLDCECLGCSVQAPSYARVRE